MFVPCAVALAVQTLQGLPLFHVCTGEVLLGLTEPEVVRDTSLSPKTMSALTR